MNIAEQRQRRLDEIADEVMTIKKDREFLVKVSIRIGNCKNTKDILAVLDEFYLENPEAIIRLYKGLCKSAEFEQKFEDSLGFKNRVMDLS